MRLSAKMNTRDNKWKCPGKGDFSSEKELSMTKGFTDGLRFRGSLTEAQDLEKAQGKEFQVRREGNKRSHQDCGGASLGDWEDHREKYFTAGENTNLRKKMRGLVWDILSFKRWQNNPKKSAEFEES